MNISVLLSDDEIKGLQKSLYEYFDTGYAFEEFLKEYLLKIGLDEVEVTQRSRDGGVDLKAVRRGLGDFSDIDVTHYYIQAKRYALDNKVTPRHIRELRGIIPAGYKGMFITTSDFTKDAAKEALRDPSRPVIEINGKSLVMSCVDNQIGFLFKPFFSKEQMDRFLGKVTDADRTAVVVAPHASIDICADTVEKELTANDIRARIISIPATIMKRFDDTLESIDVLVNDDKIYHLNIIRGRNYFGGVTQLFKDYGLITTDGVMMPKRCKWSYCAGDSVVKLFIEG